MRIAEYSNITCINCKKVFSIPTSSKRSREKRNGEIKYCSRKCHYESNKLFEKCPNLISEWDFEKNKDMGYDFYTATTSIKDKVWWICQKCNSSFDMKISKRVNRNQSCPYCASQRINITNCLATKNPELAKQWHPTKNGDLTQYDVTPNSHQKVWWIGECGHEWDAQLSHRNKGGKCPYCSGRRVGEYNNISVTHPEGAKFYNNEKNEIKVDKITRYSGRKVWWICNECNHEWEATVCNF